MEPFHRIRLDWGHVNPNSHRSGPVAASPTHTPARHTKADSVPAHAQINRFSFPV